MGLHARQRPAAGMKASTRAVFCRGVEGVQQGAQVFDLSRREAAWRSGGTEPRPLHIRQPTPRPEAAHFVGRLPCQPHADSIPCPCPRSPAHVIQHFRANVAAHCIHTVVQRSDAKGGAGQRRGRQRLPAPLPRVIRLGSLRGRSGIALGVAGRATLRNWKD